MEPLLSEELQLDSESQISENDHSLNLKRKRDDSSSNECQPDDNSLNPKKKPSKLSIDLTLLNTGEETGEGSMKEADFVPTTSFNPSQSEGSNLVQKEPSEMVVILDEIQPAQKSINSSYNKRNEKKSPINSNDQLGEVSSQKKMKKIKAKLDAAEISFKNSDFVNAAKAFKKIFRIENISTILSKDSYQQAFRLYCDSYLNLWKKEEDQELRNYSFKKAFSNLEKYLLNETNVEVKKKFFMWFAASVFEHSVTLIESNPYSSFKYFMCLLKTDLKHKKLISADLFKGYLDDILHNMTVCISEQNVARLVINMRNRMIEILKNPLIPAKQRETYQKWLNEKGKEELSGEISECFTIRNESESEG